MVWLTGSVGRWRQGIAENGSFMMLLSLGCLGWMVGEVRSVCLEVIVMEVELEGKWWKVERYEGLYSKWGTTLSWCITWWEQNSLV